MINSIPIILGSYMWGGIPSGYLVARYVKGIDIRQYGSGNVGASNVSTHVGTWIALLLGTFDTLIKGTLPITIAIQTSQPEWTQVAVGLSSIAGHNWSPYLRFTGGRGVSTSIGIMLGLFMWKELLAGVFMIGILGGIITKETALWTLIASIVIPPIAHLLGQPIEVVYTSIGIAILLVLKRLGSNWEHPLKQDRNLAKVLSYRLLWDRDVPNKATWTTRNPS